MEKLLNLWIIPIITGILVWVITTKFGHRILRKKEEAGNTRSSIDELPLTVKIKDSKIPVGYYRLTDKTAKRMEPEFYKEMKDYINRPLTIWFVSLIMLFVGLGNIWDDISFSSAIVLCSLVNVFALFPWKAIFK